jgi:hypothetical protein
MCHYYVIPHYGEYIFPNYFIKYCAKLSSHCYRSETKEYMMDTT